MSTIAIRPARQEEKPTIVDMILKMALESEGRALNRSILEQGVQKVFDMPALGTYWVLEEAGSLIGNTLITLEWSDWNNAPYWWLQSVYLAPEYRGKGLFENLLSQLEQAAQEAGACELRLYVETDNQRAIRAYEKTGFSDGHYLMMSKAIQLKPVAPAAAEA